MNRSLSLLFAGLCTAACAQMPSILWQHVYGGSGAEFFNQAAATPDGGWVLAGNSASTDGDVTGNNGGTDAWVVKLDATGAISWQRTYGGSGTDVLGGICLSGDGGYYVCGSSTSTDGDLSENYGQKDAWVMKLSATGTIVWQDVVGGALDDSYSRVIPTQDGNILCVGSSHTNLGGDPIPHYGGFDGHVIKYSPSGSILWQRIWGGSSDDELFRVQATADGGYIVGGQSTSTNVSGIITETAHSSLADVWVLKLDATGAITWQRMIGGTAVEQTFDLLLTTDGQYLVAGHASSSDGDIPPGQGVHDALLIKLSATGATQWLKTMGSSQMDAAYSVMQLSDGGYLFVGSARANDGDVTGFHGFQDVWLVKTDGTGELEWQGCLGGTGSDSGRNMLLTADGGLLIVGSANSADGDVPEALGGGDLWVIKTGAVEVGIAEALPAFFSIGPNPSTGTVRLYFDQAMERAEVRITDAHGRVVRTLRANGLSLEVDLLQQPAGMYMVEVVAQGGRFARPLLLAPAN